MLFFNLDQILMSALTEDLSLGDLTTDTLSLVLPEFMAQQTASFINRQPCVASGLTVAERVFRLVDDQIQFKTHVQPGSYCPVGTVLATVTGLTSSLLKAERTALNFLQHLCGIATCTRQFVQKIDGTPARMTDTRKTTPGLRILEKQAVRDGGGFPHRFNLGTAAMLKDNHIIAAGGIGPAVRLLKQHVSHTVKVEVEIDHLHQLAEALEAGADIILLDNMTPDQVTTAVNQIAGKAITEASGGICLETVRSYALTGVQYLSTSQLTVGAKAIDIGLDF